MPLHRALFRYNLGVSMPQSHTTGFSNIIKAIIRYRLRLNFKLVPVRDLELKIPHLHCNCEYARICCREIIGRVDKDILYTLNILVTHYTKIHISTYRWRNKKIV